jgi:uncharacterized protein YqjF (DUF2071 family)
MSTASAACPLTVRKPVMLQRWDTLTFLHWKYPPHAVQSLLPPGLTVDPHEGYAWVALVPFTMRVTLPHVPAPPWLGRFCETNVRTYVRDQADRPGVWFFSLDASRLAAVVTARKAYRLPYFWSSMSVSREPDRVVYETKRLWPRSRAVASRVVVHIGPPFEADDLGERDHFLTARWRVFSNGSRDLRYTEAEHVPWPLHRVEVLELADGLLAEAGLPSPATDPLAHFSPGVDVRIGRPHRAR